jgi:ABC-type multidrug transport system ATPase subunit
MFIKQFILKKHVLEVDSVQKQLNSKWILSDVYLKCETNDIIGLLGRNGSGKSTLLKIIFGIIPSDNKCIRINGIVKNKTSDLLQEVSYLSQEKFIPNYLTVKKAIYLSVEPEREQNFYDDEMIQSITDKRIKQLSGGELRYLEIKILLSKSSKFVLLDEPYNGLSPLMVEKINQLIKDNSFQKGIIITDHDYENIIRISNQLLLLKNGKIHHLKDETELIEKGYLKG